MAIRGSSKRRSIDHENYIANLYKGRRSKSSGASDHDPGDVRTEKYLIECKMTGTPGKEKKLPRFVQQLEKVCEEAYQEGKIPILALRYFAPESILSDRQGWIDLEVRKAVDGVSLS